MMDDKKFGTEVFEEAVCDETGCEKAVCEESVREETSCAEAVCEEEIHEEQKEPENNVPGADSEEKKQLPFGVGVLFGAACMALIAAAVIIFVFVVGKTAAKGSGYADTQTKVNEIMELVGSRYIGEIPDSEELNAAIDDGIGDALMASLGDKYAKYYTKEEYQDLLESVKGKFTGIGVSIVQNEDGSITVVKVFDGSPAQAGGLQAGDILAGTGERQDYEDIDELVADVRGPKGTTVDLLVIRDGEEFWLTLERDEVANETVAHKMLENNIGYICIEEFDTVTIDQFNNALDSLLADGAEAFIIDLRNNLGGDYDSVVSICDRVLPEGIILTAKDKQGTVHTEMSDEKNKLEAPIVVLTNENTASASEVFTGALKDHGIATVVGTVTYGKGVIQSIYPLKDGSGLKFTTEEYFTPNGNAVNGVGITPDVIVELPEEVYEDGILEEDEDIQLQKAIEILKKQITS